MSDRTAWLEDRRKGVGGSDAAALLNVGYGCTLKLWRDKRGETPDFPREETAAMKLGSFLEPFFADMYADKTGRNVYPLKFPISHPDIPELRANLDRLTNEGTEPEWPLEIKSVGREMFYRTKREGLPDDYILQLHHYMLVTGAYRGSYAIGSRDSGELLYWDVDRSDAICDDILAAIGPFWAKVQNGPAPDRLEPDDRRCQRCEYRRSCQGSALIQMETNDEMPQVESLRPLLSEYDERRALLEEAEILMDETKEELKATLADRQAVMVGDRKVYFRPQKGRELINGKALMDAYKNIRECMSVVLGEVPNEEALKLMSHPLYPALPPPESFVETAKPSRPLRIF